MNGLEYIHGNELHIKKRTWINKWRNGRKVILKREKEKIYTEGRYIWRGDTHGVEKREMRGIVHKEARYTQRSERGDTHKGEEGRKGELYTQRKETRGTQAGKVSIKGGKRRYI